MRSAPDATFLVQFFGEFYRKVLQLEAVAASIGPPVESEESVRGEFTVAVNMRTGETEDLSPAPASPAEETGRPAAVRSELLALLERQAVEVKRHRGEFAATLYHEAQYAMAALADETFLYLEWNGTHDWKKNTLESRLFHSHRAGEEVFVRIDQVLRSRDPVNAQLAQIYLMCLGLGFLGKYRDVGKGAEQLWDYRRRLFEFIASEEPQLLNTSRHLFPVAYENTLDRGVGTKLPYLRPWKLAFAALLALWVLAADFVWGRLTMEVKDYISRIPY